MLLARRTWAEKLKGRKVIYFIDNEGAPLSLVKAYSPILSSLHMIISSIEWDVDHGVDSWYARVPTWSNIADEPSRMIRDKLLKKIGAKNVQPVFPSGYYPAEVL